MLGRNISLGTCDVKLLVGDAEKPAWSKGRRYRILLTRNSDKFVILRFITLDSLAFLIIDS